MKVDCEVDVPSQVEPQRLSVSFGRERRGVGRGFVCLARVEKRAIRAKYSLDSNILHRRVVLQVSIHQVSQGLRSFSSMMFEAFGFSRLACVAETNTQLPSGSCFGSMLVLSDSPHPNPRPSFTQLTKYFSRRYFTIVIPFNSLVTRLQWNTFCRSDIFRAT